MLSIVTLPCLLLVALVEAKTKTTTNTCWNKKKKFTKCKTVKGGAIAGIVIGSIFLVVTLVIIWLLLRHRKQKRKLAAAGGDVGARQIQDGAPADAPVADLAGEKMAVAYVKV